MLSEESTSNRDTPQGPPPTNDKPDDNESGGLFECNICFEQATEPVITVCGHLFCWPCLYRWLQAQQNANSQCPVCKAGIQRDKIIPIYGRGRDTPSADTTRAPTASSSTDENIPNRPRGQRPDAPINPNYNPFAGHPFFSNAHHSPFFTFGGMHSIQFSDVRSFFPFTPHLWSGLFNSNTPIPAESLDPNIQQRAFMSRLLMFIGCLLILILILF
jgi:hypothetical protein